MHYAVAKPSSAKPPYTNTTQMTKNGQNYPKMAKNYPKCPKMNQNRPKWSEMFRQMVQMRQGIPTPNYLT